VWSQAFSFERNRLRRAPHEAIVDTHNSFPRDDGEALITCAVSGKGVTPCIPVIKATQDAGFAPVRPFRKDLSAGLFDPVQGSALPPTAQMI
jgi:hypothetical protein